jgi:hypothetical protein
MVGFLRIADNAFAVHIGSYYPTGLIVQKSQHSLVQATRCRLSVFPAADAMGVRVGNPAEEDDCNRA